MEKLFEKASRIKARFISSKGLLSVEELWDLNLSDLNDLAKKINKELKAADEEDFLKEETKKDADLRLAFDIVIHILETKKTEKAERLDSAKEKVKREKILKAIEKKKEDELSEMSVKDLEKLL